MKKDGYQFELFSRLKTISREANKPAANPLSIFMHNYEKTILIIVGLIIVSIVSFSLGVERGKRIVMLKTNSHLDLALKVPQSSGKQMTSGQQNQSHTPKVNAKDMAQPIIKKEEIIKKGELRKSMQNYTIQIASYKTKIYAQKEANILRKKGLASLTLSKDGYIILCVGNFPDKETAKSLLSELKKYYRDCFIKRL